MGRVIVQPDTIHLTGKGNIVLHANGDITVESDNVVEATISQLNGKGFVVELKDKDPTTGERVHKFKGRPD